MHANHTATADLVLEQLPSGDHAWLRPAAATQLDRYQLFSLPPNTPYVVLERSRGDWALVRSPSGTEGWMRNP
jgi:hypothetical protein